MNAPDRVARIVSVNRPWAVLALVIGLVLVSFGLDPDGSLGTDTGGKVATIAAMTERGDWNPSLGYWAESSDPEGLAHPFFGTRRTERGWINVTSLPMILGTRLLDPVLGGWSLLVLPILGSALTCLAAGELGRRLGGSTWRIGFLASATCSPVWMYGLDFWEHSLGLGLMISGAVLVLNSITPVQMSALHAAGAGFCFGLAATLRQEALIFGAVAGMVCLLSGPRVPPVDRIVRAAAMAMTAVVMLGLNHSLESVVYGQALRTGRSVGTVTSAAGTAPVVRLNEGILTLASPINQLHPLSIGMALLLLVGVVWFGLAVLTGSDRQRPAVLCGLVVLLLFLRTVVLGPTFVPGLFAAIPLAGLGLAAALHARDRNVLALTLAPLPLVWATQYPGAAEAQWAGRYILMSGLVLAVYGCIQFSRLHPRVVAGFLAANLALSALGLSWLVVRTHNFGDAAREVAAVDGVVVFTESFIAREAAPLGLDRQWLSAREDEQRRAVTAILLDRNVDSFTLLALPQEPELDFDGFGIVSRSAPVSYGSFELLRISYARNAR